MASNFLLYATATIISLGVSFIIGFLVLKFILKQPINDFFSQLFVSILIGCISITTLYAVISTNGRTILLGFVPLAIYFFCVHKKHKRISVEHVVEDKNIIIQVFYISLVILPIILVMFLQGLPTDYSIYPDYFFDSVFYSKLSEYIPLTGNENTFREASLISQDFAGATPYHYFELWLNALISNIFGLKHLICYETSIKAFLLILLVIGFLACIAHFVKINIFHIIICISFLGIAGTYFSAFDRLSFIKEYNEMQSFTMFSTLFLHKIILITIFLTALLLAVLKNRLELLVFLVVGVGIVNFLSIAGMFSAFFIVLLINEFYSLGFEKTQARHNLIALLCSFFFIIGFYAILSPKENALSATNLSVVDTVISNIYLIKSKINYIIGLAISHIAFYILFVPVLVLISKKLFDLVMKNRRAKMISLLFVSILLFSTIISAFLAGIPDYAQIYMNNLTPILYLLPFVIYLVLLKNKKQSVTYGIFLLLIFAYINYPVVISYNQKKENIYSNKYLRDVKNKLDEIKNPLGICIYTDSIGNNGSAVHNTLGAYMKVMKPYFNTVNAGTLLLKSSTKNITTLNRLEMSVFVQYAKKRKNENFDDIFISFVKEYKIEYLIYTGNQIISDKIKALFKEQITDKNTGEVFALLKI